MHGLLSQRLRPRNADAFALVHLQRIAVRALFAAVQHHHGPRAIGLDIDVGRA